MRRSAKRYNVAVVGATGAVGTEMLRVLAEAAGLGALQGQARRVQRVEP
jgi:aspartate-semialdehyde dehydrogenase